MNTSHRPFRPAWWLPGPHLPTIWASMVRKPPAVALRRERVELPDGDFLDLDWHGPATGPTVLLLHGLEGSSDSRYVRGILNALAAEGWRGVLMHFRGCSGTLNRLDRSYHSGETGDPAFVIRHLAGASNCGPIAVVGYSLGGNVLLKMLAESGTELPIAAAVAVSVPFELARCSQRMSRGFSRIYQRRLLNRLKGKLRRKYRARPAAFDIGGLNQASDFFRFDDLVTAPLHGFDSAEDYYRRSSSRQFLRGIRIPTLILHAVDDPFMTPEVIPSPAELGPTVELEVHARGGHVGFVEGVIPGFGRYWLEHRIPVFLKQFLN